MRPRRAAPVAAYRVLIELLGHVQVAHAYQIAAVLGPRQETEGIMQEGPQHIQPEHSARALFSNQMNYTILKLLIIHIKITLFIGSSSYFDFTKYIKASKHRKLH